MKKPSLTDIDIYKIKWALKGEGFSVEVKMFDNDIPLLKVTGRARAFASKKHDHS